ncbi:MAG TPA: site-2 protease family protein [Anaerolineales bacterium]|nr:site-2 protease family protein [Anaerolineales bacterium]
MTLPDTDVLTSIVSRVFRVDEVTLGDPKQGYFMRYRGQLLRDSVEAYDQLAEAMRPYDITPMFRIEDERQAILLIQGMPKPKPGRVWVNILLFALTLLSVLYVGFSYSMTGPLPNDPGEALRTVLLNLWRGWPFAVSLLGILLAHEFGHYFAGRARGAAVTLPYFIPFPFFPIGTMGAFIQMKSLPKNKRALFDLAIAGPLAGLVVAIPVLILGLSLSPVETTKVATFTKTANTQDICPNNAQVGQTYTCQGLNFLEGNSILYLGMKYLIKGELLPSPPHYTISPVLYWIRYFFTGTPLPIGGQDVMLHPVAMAGWVGLLVTFMNLIPAGQLDGGHVLFTVFGKRASRILPIILVFLVLLGFLYTGWWLWAFLIFLLGRSHAEPLDQITQLDSSRKGLAVLLLIVFLLVLTPIPFMVY